MSKNSTATSTTQRSASKANVATSRTQGTQSSGAARPPSPNDPPPTYDQAAHSGFIGADVGAWPGPEAIVRHISVDLTKACLLELKFLASVEREQPAIYDDRTLWNAIRRYETIWLPMMAKERNVKLVPPLDVHWIWHTHMTCPHAYRRDCTAQFGAIVEHTFTEANVTGVPDELTMSKWRVYAPNDPYDWRESMEKYGSGKGHARKATYDLAEASKRQQDFNYQISLPHFSDPRYLKSAVDRYVKFLYLKQKYWDKFLTPCYDFDLVWHTHQVHPSAYIQDCTALFNAILPHDDTSSDRHEGSKLANGEQLTRQLWNAHFKESFYKSGAMYRGHGSPSSLGVAQHLREFKSGYANIHAVRASGIPFGRHSGRLTFQYGRRLMKLSEIAVGKDEDPQKAYKATWAPKLFASPTCSRTQQSFPYDEKRPKEMEVDLQLYDRSFCCKKNVVRYGAKVPLSNILSAVNPTMSSAVLQVPLKAKEGSGDASPLIELWLKFTVPRKFKLIASAFSAQVLSASPLNQLYQGGARNRIPGRDVPQAYMAFHTLVETFPSVSDQRAQSRYHVEVVHDAASVLSMITIKAGGSAVVAGHLIGYETLPSKDQLEGDSQQAVPHLTSPYERAMLLMNSRGNYAVVKGLWQGFRPQTTKKVANRTQVVPGSPGFLKVEVYDLVQKKSHTFNVPTGREPATVFHVGDIRADLLSGEITCCAASHVCENLGYAFAVGMLLVLCNPDIVRSPPPLTGLRRGNRRRPAAPRGATPLPVHTWVVALACGYGANAPSNRYFRSEEFKKTVTTTTDRETPTSSYQYDYYGGYGYDAGIPFWVSIRA